MTNHYTTEEETILLGLARRTLEAITCGQSTPIIDLDTLPPALGDDRACFVTMRRRSDGALRGCTGTLLARRALAKEVVSMTVQTALNDPRFRPVSAEEVDHLHLEISILTPPRPLEFDSPEDLLRKLHPGIDGVTLKLHNRRATFLPQVWDSYPDPRIFLSLLSEKMGRAPDAWLDPDIEIETYQAVVIEEPA
jgi:AmmeMemoRadiSam system protein A